MTGPSHFDGVADKYAESRPPYPTELWRDVLATGLVCPGRRALDLGAGTGQATGELLSQGMDVVAVEPGAHLAAILKERYPGVVVHRCRAEDFRPEPASIDLAVAATSIHWLDLDVVLPIVHRSLAEGGRFAVLRNVFGDADAPVTLFRQAVQRIVSGRRATRVGNPEDREATAEKLTRSGLFSIDAVHHYPWTLEQTAGQIHALFSTFSDWTPREVEEAATAVTSLGGHVTEYYSSWLITLKPVSHAAH